jgi:hypothetical protein
MTSGSLNIIQNNQLINLNLIAAVQHYCCAKLLSNNKDLLYRQLLYKFVLYIEKTCIITFTA